MGIFQSNAGGAWDNAKKSFEKGVMINGEMFYKKSEPHKASVTGDTVGDPFKDTSGPSMNILIKLMSIVSLVIAPYIAVVATNTTAETCEHAHCDKAMMEAHCKESGVCAATGKACTWDEATKSCAHTDGTACDEMNDAGAKACCTPEGEMKAECKDGAKKDCCKPAADPAEH